MPRAVARARAAERRAFEAEARAQRLAAVAFQHEPRVRAGGPLMRDARLVQDTRTGRYIAADTVNRQFRRVIADLAALRQRFVPSPMLVWNPAHTRLVANTAANREALVAAQRAAADAARAARAPQVEERRQAGIARTQARRADADEHLRELAEGAGPYEGEPEEPYQRLEEEHDEPEPYEGEAEGIVFEPRRQGRRDRRGNIDHETALGGNVGKLGPIFNATHDKRGLTEWFLEFAEDGFKEELQPRVIELHAIKAVLTFTVVQGPRRRRRGQRGPGIRIIQDCLQLPRYHARRDAR